MPQPASLSTASLFSAGGLAAAIVAAGGSTFVSFPFAVALGMTSAFAALEG